MKSFPVVLIASLVFFSCNIISGNGNVKDEKRELSNIHAVRASGSIDIEIKNGDAYRLLVQDDENLLPYVVTEVNNGVLNIHYRNGTTINSDHAKVTITAPTLDKIICTGSGNVEGVGTIKNATQIEFNLAGSGDVIAQVDAPSIKVSSSGSGNVKLEGRTREFECSISGSGDANCMGLQSENTTVAISGSGNAHVFSSVHLVAKASGSGNIYYSGNPASPEIHTYGSGNVRPQK